MVIHTRRRQVREFVATQETELWNYLKKGDGDSCPLYDSCELRKSGYWCIIDHQDVVGDMSYLINSQIVDPNRGQILKTIRQGKIFRLVEWLANKHMDLSNITSPPVPEWLIESITQPDNTEIRLIPLSSYHGALWFLDGSWIIQLNKNDDYCVRRLTLFHEAFHILAHCNSTPCFRKINNKKGAFNELLAEYFTYCVLMPEKWVRSKWAETNNPVAMAKIFQVPVSAMVTMLTSLDLMAIPRQSVLTPSNN
jgi:Zn-dependent peptidase ImmA (M78 family)